MSVRRLRSSRRCARLTGSTALWAASALVSRTSRGAAWVALLALPGCADGAIDLLPEAPPAAPAPGVAMPPCMPGPGPAMMPATSALPMMQPRAMGPDMPACADGGPCPMAHAVSCDEAGPCPMTPAAMPCARAGAAGDSAGGTGGPSGGAGDSGVDSSVDSSLAKGVPAGP